MVTSALCQSIKVLGFGACLCGVHMSASHLDSSATLSCEDFDLGMLCETKSHHCVRMPVLTVEDCQSSNSVFWKGFFFSFFVPF